MHAEIPLLRFTVMRATIGRTRVLPAQRLSLSYRLRPAQCRHIHADGHPQGGSHLAGQITPCRYGFGVTIADKNTLCVPERTEVDVPQLYRSWTQARSWGDYDMTVESEFLPAIRSDDGSPAGDWYTTVTDDPEVDSRSPTTPLGQTSSATAHTSRSSPHAVRCLKDEGASDVPAWPRRPPTATSIPHGRHNDGSRVAGP